MISRVFRSGPTLDELHEDYAKRGRVDQQAPIVSRSEIRIDASLERVWRVVGHPEHWPALATGFSKAALDGHHADAGLRFTLNGFPISARLAVYEPLREITWTGKALWIKAIDRHLLESAPGGATRLVVEESMGGTAVALMYSEAKLAANHRVWLTAMKSAAERALV